MEKKRNNNFLLWLGNLFIIASLLGLAFTFYPLLSAYFFPSSPGQAIAASGIFITIPKIHAYSPIVENVDPFNEQVYKQALRRGVAHAKNTKLPGENGMTFLFAHSSGMPWELTRFNTVFLRLGELKKGDTIIIYKDAKQFTYTVFDKKVVWPNEVSYLLNTSKTQLILQTCAPIGTSLKRLLIFATLQHPKPDVPTRTTSGVY